MRITKIGQDLVTIDEKNLEDETLLKIPRIHLIRLAFETPTEHKIRGVLELFNKTNRFIIDDNIRVYNGFLKNTNKKYYVSNKKGTKIISFLRRNNKILLNINLLSSQEREFMLCEDIFYDLLDNLEIMCMKKEDFDPKREILEKWSGNIILSDV